MHKRRLKFFIPAFAWAAIIFSVSAIPDLPTTTFGFKMIDKIAHFGEFFILGIFIAHALSKQSLRTINVFLISACISALYGISDEFHQFFVPGRQMDGLDMLADIIGGVSASGVYVSGFWKRGS